MPVAVAVTEAVAVTDAVCERVTVAVIVPVRETDAVVVAVVEPEAEIVIESELLCVMEDDGVIVMEAVTLLVGVSDMEADAVKVTEAVGDDDAPDVNDGELDTLLLHVREADVLTVAVGDAVADSDVDDVSVIDAVTDREGVSVMEAVGLRDGVSETDTDELGVAVAVDDNEVLAVVEYELEPDLDADAVVLPLMDKLFVAVSEGTELKDAEDEGVMVTVPDVLADTEGAGVVDAALVTEMDCVRVLDTLAVVLGDIDGDFVGDRDGLVVGLAVAAKAPQMKQYEKDTIAEHKHVQQAISYAMGLARCRTHTRSLPC